MKVGFFSERPFYRHRDNLTGLHQCAKRLAEPWASETAQRAPVTRSGVSVVILLAEAVIIEFDVRYEAVSRRHAVNGAGLLCADFVDLVGH